MRFSFVDGHRREYTVPSLCGSMEISPSGYYAWRLRQPSRRHVRHAALVAAIKRIHLESNGTYGSPRMHQELVEECGFVVGKNTVAHLMRQCGISALPHKKRYKVTTDSDHQMPVAANVLNRKFSSKAPDLKWVTDITYIFTKEGWLYLAIVLDLFSRKVVGYHMDKRITRNLVIQAAHMALRRRQPKPGLLHHSDRGSQYASYDYRQILDRTGMVPSMSRKGNCYDNAAMESFFATLKKELIYRRPFDTRQQAMMAIFEYVEGWYNKKRRHSALGQCSPEHFEQRVRNP